MIGFGIDQVQAEYVAEIKLRNINKEFLLNRLQETDSRERNCGAGRFAWFRQKIKAVICKELEAVSAKYGQPRKTLLIFDHEQEEPGEPDVPDIRSRYSSREGYFKKSRRSRCACPASRSSKRETNCFSAADDEQR